jgi:hypothetical protein
MADGKDDEVTTTSGAWGGASPSVPLTKAIKVHGDEVKVLTFREPTGADIQYCGVPCTLDFAVDPPKVQFNAPEMSMMIGQLAGANPAAVGSMAAQDWINCAWRLSRFFVPRLTN